MSQNTDFNLDSITKQKEALLKSKITDAGLEIAEFEEHMKSELSTELNFLTLSYDMLETQVYLFKRKKMEGYPSGMFKLLVDTLEISPVRNNLHIYPVHAQKKDIYACLVNHISIEYDSIKKHDHGIFSGVTLQFMLQLHEMGKTVIRTDYDLKLFQEALTKELPFIVIPPLNIKHPRIIDKDYINIVKNQYETFLNDCIAIQSIRNSKALNIFLNSKPQKLQEQVTLHLNDVSKQLKIDKNLTKAKLDSINEEPFLRIPIPKSKAIVKFSHLIHNYLNETESEFEHIDKILSKLIQTSADIETQYDALYQSLSSISELYSEMSSVIGKNVIADEAIQRTKLIFKNNLNNISEQFKVKGKVISQ